VSVGSVVRSGERGMEDSGIGIGGMNSSNDQVQLVENIDKIDDAIKRLESAVQVFQVQEELENTQPFEMSTVSEDSGLNTVRGLEEIMLGSGTFSMTDKENWRNATNSSHESYEGKTDDLLAKNLSGTIELKETR